MGGQGLASSSHPWSPMSLPNHQHLLSLQSFAPMNTPFLAGYWLYFYRGRIPRNTLVIFFWGAPTSTPSAYQAMKFGLALREEETRYKGVNTQFQASK